MSLIEIRKRLSDPEIARIDGAIIGLLPQGVIGLQGASGVRKTFVATRMAVSVAAGLEFGPFPTKPGLVVYVAAEDRDGVERRILSAVTALGLDDTIPVQIIDPPGKLNDRATADEIGEIIDDLELSYPKLTLLIWDTLSKSFSGSTNDDGSMGIALDTLHSIASRRASVVIVHHLGKNEGQGARGSKVFFDRADAVIEVSEVDAATSNLTVEKQRSGEKGQRFRVEFEGHTEGLAPGVDYETLVIADIDGRAAANAAPLAAPRRGRRKQYSEADIIAGLETRQGPMTVAQAARHLGETRVMSGHAANDRASLVRMLPDLLATGRLEQLDDGKLATRAGCTNRRNETKS